jgi:hypothetical protein
MDNHIILKWSITILATLSAVAYFYIRNRRREKSIYTVLHSFAKENNSTVTSSDHWANTLIGIDQMEAKKLFFIRTANNHSIKEVINLSEVRNCRLANIARTVTYDKQKVHVVDRIELIFSFLDSGRPEITLEFYNNDYDSLTLTGELQLAQKWLEIVNGIVVSNKNQKKETGKAKLRAAPSPNRSSSPTNVAAFAMKKHISRTPDIP